MGAIAKPLKIEALGLQALVASGLKAGLNPQEIAERCTKKAGELISNMAVRRYIDSRGSAEQVMAEGSVATIELPKGKVERAVKDSPKRVGRLVDSDIDLIELQYKTTKALADRFEWIAALPDNFERRMLQLHELLKQDDIDTTHLDSWGLAFTLELRRNIGNMAALNREIRQNGQFMATLREKAFEFNLIQEYLMLFLEGFKKAEQEHHGSSAAFEAAEQQIASNPRMQRIVEQQQQMRGYQE